MKTRIFLMSLLLCFTTILFHAQHADAQSATQKKTSKADKIKAAVQSKQYVFIPQTMLPTGFTSRQLNSPYDVSVFGDSLISYLPYMGRAYSASYGNTDSPLSFTSTKFDYTQTERKKGGWDITMKTKDVTTDAYTYQLTIYDNGTAYLQVTSNNRQPISFNGYVKEREKKRK